MRASQGVFRKLVEAGDKPAWQDHRSTPRRRQVEPLETRTPAGLRRKDQHAIAFLQPFERQRRIGQQAVRKDREHVVAANRGRQVAHSADNLKLRSGCFRRVAQLDRFLAGAVAESDDLFAALREGKVELMARERAAGECTGLGLSASLANRN